MKKFFLSGLLFLICVCSLHAQYFDSRSRVVEDMPLLGSRIDLSHRLVRDSDILGVFLFNQPIGNRSYDLSRNYGAYGEIPYYLEGAASPNDPEWYGTVGWEFNSVAGTWAVSVPTRTILTNYNTFAFWIMITSNVTGYIIAGNNVDGSIRIVWVPDATYKGFTARMGAVPPGPTFATSKRIAEINKIHHVVVTATIAGNTELYVDNERQNPGLAKTGASHLTFTLGSWSDHSLPADFVIYSLYIWNEPLTAADVEELYLDPFCIIEEEIGVTGVWAAITEAAASRVIIVR